MGGLRFLAPPLRQRPQRRSGPTQRTTTDCRGVGTMVYLSRIYTKTGDKGDTALGDGSRVPMDHPRVAAYGSVDELNAVLGLVVAHAPDQADLLRTIQNDLFDVGADLCVPHEAAEAPGQRLRVRA